MPYTSHQRYNPMAGMYGKKAPKAGGKGGFVKTPMNVPKKGMRSK